MKNATEIAKQVSDAINAGVKAAANVADSGTCCLDYVVIPVGSAYPIPRKNKALEAALTAAGVDFDYTTAGHGRGYSISIPHGGQAWKRTHACDTTAKALSSLNAYVNYVTD